VFGYALADDRGAGAHRVITHRGQRAIGVCGRHDRDDASFARHVERIEPPQLARRTNLGTKRQ